MTRQRQGWLATVGRATLSLFAVLGDDARRRRQLGGSRDRGQGQGDDQAGASDRRGADRQRPKIPISRDLEETRAMLKEHLGDSSDIVYRPFTSSMHGGSHGFVLYINGLADDDKILVLTTSIVDLSNPPHQLPHVSDDPTIDFAGVILRSTQMRVTADLAQVVDDVLAGGTAAFFDGSDHALLADTRWNPGRSVTQPAVEAELRGPQDAMVEHLRLNTTLIRRRIRDQRLRVESMTIGRRTKTEVELLYIQGIADERVLTEARGRLKRIDIDGLLGTGYIEELIKDSPRSPFDTMMTTERPDRVCASLLEGQFAILMDNTPFALIAPTTFWRSLTAPGDYYQNFWAASFFRWLRFGALLLALTLPSLYVLLTTFHHEMIPTPLALAIAAGREGTPFPTVIEVLLLDLMFEVLHEAGLRLPQAVGQTVSIVGALVIGQAAVQAGLIAPATVIAVAATGLAVFAIPLYSTSITVRLLRFPLLLLSGFLGIFGFLMGTAVLALHLASLRSFGAPFLEPVVPLGGPEQKDTLIREPWWDMHRRPLLSGGKRTVR